MSLNAKKIQGGGKAIPNLEPGSYPGWLSKIYYVGMQERAAWKGEEKPPAPEVFLTYELADEYMPDDDGGEDEEKPRTMFENFNVFSLKSENAKSTERYYAFDPKDECDGEWEKLLGVPCMITVVHNKGKGSNAGKIYDNVGGVSSMRAKDAGKLREPLIETVYFDAHEPNMEVYDTLPPFIQDKIKAALDLPPKAKELYGIEVEAQEVEDEIPFE